MGGNRAASYTPDGLLPTPVVWRGCYCPSLHEMEDSTTKLSLVVLHDHRLVLDKSKVREIGF